MDIGTLVLIGIGVFIVFFLLDLFLAGGQARWV